MTDLLVIAPHPDDEILGCGATMARYLREGKSVAVFYVGFGCYPGTEGYEVSESVMRALSPPEWNCWKIKRFEGYKDQRFEKYSRAKMADRIADFVDEVRPATVLIPFYGDVNLDHRVVFEAAMVALRPVRAYIQKVACYETASSTEWGGIHAFKPNWYVEVTVDDLQKKHEALNVYGSEMKPHPHPRNQTALTDKARARGPEVCVALAEAFMTIREVDRV